MPVRAAQFLLVSLALVVTTATTANDSIRPEPVADPGSFLGINCGKSGAHDRKAGIDHYFLKRNFATLNLARDLGLGWARCGGGPEQWYAGGKPSPENFDAVFDHATACGIRIYLFIEYRGDINREAIDDFDWADVGRAFATHFGDRVACYGVLNEVDHVASPHEPEEIVRAVRAFAEGVHGVDSKLLVSSPSLGGTPMEIERADRFLKAIGPLYQSGHLDVLNLHSYHDSRPGRPHYSSIDTSSEWSPSRNFLRAVRAAEITRDVRFAAGEFNYRRWEGTDSERARGFMTALWDQLMVVGAASPKERVGLFSIPYNIPDSRDGRQTTMADAFEWNEDGTYRWEPNEKGRVLQRSVDLTRDTRFVFADPLETGVAVLKRRDRTVWVWQNRAAFSTLAGQATVEVFGIPRGAAELTIVTADTTQEAPFQTIPLDSQTNVTLRTSDLPDNQTLLLVTDGTGDGEVGGIR